MYIYIYMYIYNNNNNKFKNMIRWVEVSSLSNEQELTFSISSFLS